MQLGLAPAYLQLGSVPRVCTWGLHLRMHLGCQTSIRHCMVGRHSKVLWYKDAKAAFTLTRNPHGTVQRAPKCLLLAQRLATRACLSAYTGAWSGHLRPPCIQDTWEVGEEGEVGSKRGKKRQGEGESGVKGVKGEGCCEGLGNKALAAAGLSLKTIGVQHDHEKPGRRIDELKPWTCALKCRNHSTSKGAGSLWQYDI